MQHNDHKDDFLISSDFNFYTICRVLRSMTSINYISSIVQNLLSTVNLCMIREMSRICSGRGGIHLCCIFSFFFSGRFGGRLVRSRLFPAKACAFSWVRTVHLASCLRNTYYAPAATKSKKAIFSTKVKGNVTRSLTLVSFERASLVEYACQL